MKNYNSNYNSETNIERIKQNETLKKELSALKKEFELFESKKGLSEEDKKQIIQGAVEQTSEESINKIFNSKTKELEKN